MPTNLIKRITTKGIIYKQVSYSQAKLLNYKDKSMIYDDTVLAASPDRIAAIVYHSGNVEHRNVEIKCLESK